MRTSTYIAEENALLGSTEWQIVAGDPLRIEGYASSTSIAAGDVLRIFVNCEPGFAGFSIRYFRMGYYGGLGGRLMREALDLPAVQQPVPLLDSARWLAECNWTVSDAFQVQSDWPSGVYLAVLTTIPDKLADAVSSYVPFVVRDDLHAHRFVYGVPFATYQAYSAWPRQGSRFWNAGVTCGNLYGASGPDGRTRSFAVSFDRPLAQYWGAGDFFAYEYPFVAWVEREGFDVAYIASEDVHHGCPSLDRCNVFLSGGHDEYVSGPARRHIEDQIARARSAIFTGANAMYFQTRYEPNAHGDRDRRLVCYKDGGAIEPGATDTVDPIRASEPNLTTCRWRDPLLSQPEVNTVGQMYTDFVRAEIPGVYAYPALVATPVAWPYLGSALVEGDVIDSFFGGEVDYPYEPGDAWFGVPLPGVRNIPSRMRLADGEVPAGSTPGAGVHACTTLYQADSGAFVLSMGSLLWGRQLAEVVLPPLRLTTRPDKRLQRWGRNLLQGLVSGSPGEFTNCRICVQTRSGDLLASDGSTGAAWTILKKDVRSHAIVSSRVAAVGTDGTLSVKEGEFDAPWIVETGDVASYALAGDRIGVLKTDGVCYVKAGSLDAEWVLETGDVVSFAISGHRVAALKTDGMLYVKEHALDSPWVTETGDVVSYALAGDRIAVLKTDGVLYVKAGPLDAEWTLGASDISSYSLAGSRIAVHKQDGNLYIKEGPPDSPWTLETGDVMHYAIADERIAIRKTDRHLYVKDGTLDAAWSDLGEVAVAALRVDRQRVVVLREDGVVVAWHGSLPREPWALRDLVATFSMTARE